MANREARIKSWLEGFKFAVNIARSEIKQFCYTHHCEVTDDRVDSGLLRSTWYFTIEGDKRNLEVIKKYLSKFFEKV